MKSIHRRGYDRREPSMKPLASSIRQTIFMMLCGLLAQLTISEDGVGTLTLVHGFRPSAHLHSLKCRTEPHRHHSTELKSLIDPSIIPTLISTSASTPPALQVILRGDATSVTTTTASTISPATSNLASNYPQLPSMISTMLASAAVVPAHGHSNPLFGPPDRYLQTGRSIAPSANALSSLGIVADQTTLPDGMTGPSIPGMTRSSIKNKGTKVLDGSKIVHHDNLPGFSEPRGILAPHTEVLDGSPHFRFGLMLTDRVLLPALDKVPFVVFFYALVEFFFLRPNAKDLYRDDVEEDPVGVTVETLSDLTVRLGIFVGLAVFVFLFT